MKILQKAKCPSNRTLLLAIDVIYLYYIHTFNFRSGNWQLHLSATRRCIPLLFSFNHTNYARWVPIYFEDCLQLPVKFSELYESFMAGGFVVQRSKSKNSAIPMDQALEQAYNKVAKSAGGVIGVTRKKKAVAQWNLIHHEKEGYRQWLEQQSEDHSQYSLHHEFSDAAAIKSLSNRDSIINYIKRLGNLFGNETDGYPIRNLATGEGHFLLYNSKLECINLGNDLYRQFKEDRLDKKNGKPFRGP